MLLETQFVGGLVGEGLEAVTSSITNGFINGVVWLASSALSICSVLTGLATLVNQAVYLISHSDEHKAKCTRSGLYYTLTVLGRELVLYIAP